MTRRRAKSNPETGGGYIAEKLAAYLSADRPTMRGGMRGVLPDTCAWIDYFRAGGGRLAPAMSQALRGQQLFTCGQVVFELMQGVRSDSDRSAVLGALGSLEYAETGPAAWIRAADLSASLRRGGSHLPQSDLLIAAVALEHGLAVLTADSHFAQIPGVVLWGESGLETRS